MSKLGWLAIGLVSLTAACGDHDDKSKKSKKANIEPTESLAVVTGRVRIAEGYSLPEYAPEDMERKVLLVNAVAAPEDLCGPAKETDRRPVSLTADGFLSGIIVAASDFTGVPPRPPKTHDVTIGKDCRLSPRTVLATKGDQMVIRNSLKYPFMPTFGPTTSTRSLDKGEKMEIPLDRAGVESVLCAITAPCGRTDVVTFNHPLSALTDDKGNFRIDHFPVDQSVTLNAWHPLFQEASVKVTVGVGETKSVDLIIAPHRRFITEEGKTGAKDDLSGTPLQRSVAAAAPAAEGAATTPAPPAGALPTAQPAVAAEPAVPAPGVPVPAVPALPEPKPTVPMPAPTSVPAQ